MASFLCVLSDSCVDDRGIRAASVAANVANFHDGIDIETYGNPDGSAALDGPKYPSKEWLVIGTPARQAARFHDTQLTASAFNFHRRRILPAV